MAQQIIIDSHIHLWPNDAANENGHSWMTPGMPLAKETLLANYYRASQQGESAGWDTIVKGVVYVETDRRYDTPTGHGIETWATGPLDEIAFVRDIVEGKYGQRDSEMLRGIVLWAPMHQPTSVLEEYLRVAVEKAGAKTWGRVKGFRFLVQAITNPNQFDELVLGKDFNRNLKLLGERGFSFDVGVDQRSGGTWQLETMAKAMVRAHADVPEDRKVTFIINHLCKPQFSASAGKDFNRWSEAISTMAGLNKSYMKLSGAFSELPSSLKWATDVAKHMQPWLSHVFQCFESRVLFGSDYPVLNLARAAGEYSWLLWKDVVQLILTDAEYGLDEKHRDGVWYGTAIKAYRLSL